MLVKIEDGDRDLGATENSDVIHLTTIVDNMMKNMEL